MMNAVHILDEALSSGDDCHNINARLYGKCPLEDEEATGENSDTSMDSH